MIENINSVEKQSVLCYTVGFQPNSTKYLPFDSHVSFSLAKSITDFIREYAYSTFGHCPVTLV